MGRGHEHRKLQEGEGDEQECKAGGCNIIERGDGVELDAPVLEQDLDEAEPEGLGEDGAHLEDDTHHVKVKLSCIQGRGGGGR